MKCPRCSYFNLPGVDPCGRCGASLNAAATPSKPASFDELYPPRARHRTMNVRLREPLRRAARATGAERLQAPAIHAGAALRDVAATADFRPWLLSSCAVVPGLIQAFQGRRRTAVILGAATVALCGSIFLTIHNPVSDVLIGVLLALSAYSVWEVADECFPGWQATEAAAGEARRLRTLRLGLLAVGIVASTVFCGYSVIGHWYAFWNFRTDRAAPVFLPGDGLIVRRVDPSNSGILRRGDVVVYAEGVGEFGEWGLQAERIVGLPGDRIETRGNTIWVNGRTVPPSQLPLTFRTPLPAVNIAVPNDEVCLWRGVWGERERVDDARPYILVSRDRIHGRAVALYQPPARRRWFH